MKHYDKLNSIFTVLDSEMYNNRIPTRTAFDGISQDIVYSILILTKTDKSVAISSYGLARRCNTSRQRIRSRLLHLTNFGLLLVVNTWANDSTGKKKPMMIYPNPILNSIVLTNSKISHRNAALKEFVAMGIRRMEFTDLPLQGFEGDVPYGTMEMGEVFSTERAELKLSDLIGLEDEKKKEKAQLESLWRDYDKKFINGCADIWQWSQAYLGHGRARPHWEGEIGDLSPTAKRERAELTKIFRQYGTRVSALAWYVFVGGEAELDEKGRPKFDLVKPHKQYSSIDKKPAQFSKHFNAILIDPHYLNLAQQNWDKHEALLKSYFPETFGVGPKDDDEYSKTGIIFGQETPQL